MVKTPVLRGRKAVCALYPAPASSWAGRCGVIALMCGVMTIDIEIVGVNTCLFTWFSGFYHKFDDVWPLKMLNDVFQYFLLSFMMFPEVNINV